MNLDSAIIVLVISSLAIHVRGPVAVSALNREEGACRAFDQWVDIGNGVANVEAGAVLVWDKRVSTRAGRRAIA